MEEALEKNPDAVNPVSMSEAKKAVYDGVNRPDMKAQKEKASVGEAVGVENAGISGLTNIEQGNMSVSGENSLNNSENSENSLSPSARMAKDGVGENFSEIFTKEVLDSFGIERLGDYIHVQKRVLDTLEKENFFTDSENRRRVDVNEESGLEIETNKSGIDETFSLNNFVRLGKFKKISKLVTIREIPNAIKYGHLLSDNVDNQYNGADPNKKFAYIEYATQVDGNDIVLKLAIKKSPQKNKFWVHSIYEIENASDSPASTVESAEAGRITADEDRIAQKQGKVNTSEQNSQENAENSADFGKKCGFCRKFVRKNGVEGRKFVRKILQGEDFGAEGEARR